MSVQQLGSIYERLLEQEPVRDADGKIVIRPNPYARKDSGSFFTPQELVDLIVDRTLKPLAEERLKAFEDKSKELKSSRRPIAERRTELLALDPAEAVLELKVLDPAMGSGHFLVTAVDFLSDYIAERIENVPAVPEWLGEEYESPLVQRIVEAIRRTSCAGPEQSDWVIDESLLTDQAIIRRMVLKRCIYGVDKNPLTVELAKVSLWLHSFTVGAPLSFLDHHLRCGDSLIGMKVQDSIEELPAERPLRQQRYTGGGERYRGNAAHRGDVRRRRRRGAPICRSVPGRGEHDGGDARPARFPLQPAMAHCGNEEEGAHQVRVPAPRFPDTELTECLQTPRPRSRGRR